LIQRKSIASPFSRAEVDELNEALADTERPLDDAIDLAVCDLSSFSSALESDRLSTAEGKAEEEDDIGTTALLVEVDRRGLDCALGR
jgi:hypothetical protein